MTAIGIFLTFFLLKPFLAALTSGAIFGLIFYPSYKWLYKQTKNRNIAGSVIVLLIILLFLIPTGMMIKSFGKQSYVVYNVIRQKLGQEAFDDKPCVEGFMCDLINPIKKFFHDPETSFYIKQLSTKINRSIFDYSTSFVLRLPSILIQVGIFLFSFFYFLRDGKDIISYLREFIPLDRDHQNHLFNKTKQIIDAIVYGNFLTALLQGILGGFAFWLFGFSSPLFWGVVIFVCGLVPVLPWLIFGPAGLYLIFDGFANASNWFILKGFLLLLTGTIIISAMDGILKPYLIGTKTKMHNLIIILGLIGGVQWFGFIGLFIGPVILTFLLTVFEIYREMKHKNKKHEI